MLALVLITRTFAQTPTPTPDSLTPAARRATAVLGTRGT